MLILSRRASESRRQVIFCSRLVFYPDGKTEIPYQSAQALIQVSTMPKYISVFLSSMLLIGLAAHFHKAEQRSAQLDKFITAEQGDASVNQSGEGQPQSGGRKN